MKLPTRPSPLTSKTPTTADFGVSMTETLCDQEEEDYYGCRIEHLGRSSFFLPKPRQSFGISLGDTDTTRMLCTYALSPGANGRRHLHGLLF